MDIRTKNTILKATRFLFIGISTSIVLIVFLILFSHFESYRLSRGKLDALYALKKFYDQCSKYPTTEEGLGNLINTTDCHTLRNTKSDFKFVNGYGNPLIYRSNGKKFELISKGILRDSHTTEEIVQHKGGF